MLNVQLDIQPQTERRLKKLLESLQNQEIFAQNIIDYQITELRKGILNIRLDLKQFEDTYQLSSEDFYRKFEEGKCDDREDFIVWAGLYEMFSENELRLKELS